ncbi:cysteine synthase family protein [Acetobacterium wieringae]|jgi:cysteine synthase A|uniref:Cysteine synthase n=1 Tax=Acetobacterium wieringae TaxID=52694 RepID=A0A1F2PEJ8_9FIRM|nr:MULTISPECIES: cysteine synthase family protein [Acetobacterium]OFV69817.1 O-acetylserine dependent cystathionine beta-synthase [Acetobacterium wieringae]UYO61538.1 cysteine synthase family protein [Acetobacterium wieringae]VUZ28394.1 O-acetylserine dependent cystathionine beta-synthase [Acetobacterium wieringae]
MAYYNDIRELIGNTPMVKLNQFQVKKGVNIFAKLELWNPGGSVKDRIGVAMIEDAEKKGLLKPGGTIIEGTAGNTGLGVALAAINRGYRVIFVVPTKFSVEKQTLMRAYGGEIVNTPRELGMQGATSKARELLKSIPDAISLQQFENSSNPGIHYDTTGPEIFNDLDGNIDYLVAGAGSGGTYSGVVRYLKEKNPNIKGILADPYGSIMGGGTAGCYDIEGIGNDFIANTMDMTLVDEVIKVDDRTAFDLVRLLAKKEGIIAGTSSGAALYGALKLTEKIEQGNIVVIFPDRGDRYFSKNLYE